MQPKKYTYQDLYESVTELQETIILRAIEISKENKKTDDLGIFSPSQVGLSLGKAETNASSYCTGALRKGMRLGLFVQPVYGKYQYTGAVYIPKYN